MVTVLALVLANLPWTASAYHHLLEARLRIGFDGFSLDEPLEAWVNDGLMAVFFFYVVNMKFFHPAEIRLFENF